MIFKHLKMHKCRFEKYKFSRGMRTNPLTTSPLHVCDCVVMWAGVVIVGCLVCPHILACITLFSYRIMVSYYPPQPLMFRVHPLMFLKPRNAPGWHSVNTFKLYDNYKSRVDKIHK